MKSDPYAELLKALRGENKRASGDGMTTREIAEKLGCSEELVRKRLRVAIGNRTVVLGHEPRRCLNGRSQTVAVYRLAGKP